MLKVVLLVAMCLMSNIAFADLNDCQNLYVGRIWVEKGEGLKAVVLLNSPTDSSGSYWAFFQSWSDEDKKAALALLTAAKLSQHRVNVTTNEADGCGIYLGGTWLTQVFLATNP